MKIIENAKRLMSSMSAHHTDEHPRNHLRSIQAQLGEMRKSLDFAQAELSSAMASVEASLPESETEPTVTPAQLAHMNSLIPIKDPTRRWFSLVRFFDKVKSEPAIQQQLFGFFWIDWAIHMVETHEGAIEKARYADEYRHWHSVVIRHRPAAQVAHFIRTRCSDNDHTTCLTVFNAMDHMEDKMVFLSTFMDRHAIRIFDDFAPHRGPASMDWMNADHPGTSFRGLHHIPDDEPDDSEENEPEENIDDALAELERLMKDEPENG